jgi:hypothetical protein
MEQVRMYLPWHIHKLYGLCAIDISEQVANVALSTCLKHIHQNVSGGQVPHTLLSHDHDGTYAMLSIYYPRCVRV